MTSLTLRIVSAVLLATGVAACSPGPDEASCTADTIGSVASVTSAKSGKVGTPVPVTYTVSIPSPCGKFQNLQEQRDGNKVYLAPTVRYEGCNCPQTPADYQGTYQFTASQPGKYIVLFPNSTTQVVTDTITIQ